MTGIGRNSGGRLPLGGALALVVPALWLPPAAAGSLRHQGLRGGNPEFGLPPATPIGLLYSEASRHGGHENYEE